MSVPAPTPAVLDNVAILRRVRDDLLEFLAPVGGAKLGYLSTVGTMRNVLEALATPPQGLFLVLLWDGEENAGSVPQSGICKQGYSVFVGQQSSLNVKPGDDIFGATGAGGTQPSLLQRVNQVRDRVRSLAWPTDLSDVVPAYQGCSQVYDAQDAPLNSFRLQFSVHAALPEVQYRDAFVS